MSLINSKKHSQKQFGNEMNFADGIPLCTGIGKKAYKKKFLSFAL